MRDLGNDVKVITLTSRYRTDWLRLSTVFPERPSSYEYDGISVNKIGFDKLTRVKVAPWASVYYLFMSRAVKEIAPYLFGHIERAANDATIVHATRNGREFLARAGLNFARTKNIPFVLTPNHHPRWKGFLYREYDKIYREADAVIALTEAEKETLIEEKGVEEARIHVTGIGPILAKEYSADEFRREYNIESKYVLYLGQQVKYKGIEAVIRAASIVWEKHPDTAFVFIGPQTNYSKALFKKVRDKRIISLGPVDLETKTSAIAGCEFICLPSAQESFGGVYVEAWSLRKTVIGGNIPSIASLIEHGRDGFLSSQDPKELAENIICLLSAPDMAGSMGNAGWKKVMERYTWEMLGAKTESIYEMLC